MPSAMNAPAPPPTLPPEIARETIRQLAQRKLAPTPENYSQLYEELSGGAAAAQPPVLRILAGIASSAKPESRRDEKWAVLIREMLRQWDRRQAGLTAARKREALEHVLGAFAGDGDRLHARLSALLRGWSERGEDARLAGEFSAAADSEPDPGTAMRELVAQTLDYAVVDRLGHSPVLQAEARDLAISARRAVHRSEFEDLGARFKRFFLRVELASEDIGELLRGLLGLLRLLTDNVAELVGDDRWMKGQVVAVQALLAEPLGRDMLRDTERGFRELVFKQSTRKVSLNQAKTALKDLVTVFVDRLATVSSSTSEFHERMTGYSQRIAATDDIAQLGGLVEELLGQTRGMQADVARAHEELVVARKLVSEYEGRIRGLEHELAMVSGQVREDQLTKTLNRRGLDEAWASESARAERQGSPLCLAVLDLDNFKHLNDRLGHQAGDRALIHLTGVVRQALRPSDVIARFGGEEFVVLLPHTPSDEAVHVMVRLQRELTRRFFMHNHERVLITFSAGVAERKAGESRDELIKRADAALYEAKRTGKNRVVPAG